MSLYNRQVYVGKACAGSDVDVRLDAAGVQWVISDPQGQGTIVNDDTQPTISINDVSHAEGNAGPTLFSFSVSLSNASYLAVTVNYATADGTATVADADYDANVGMVTFAPASTAC